MLGRATCTHKLFFQILSCHWSWTQQIKKNILNYAHLSWLGAMTATKQAPFTPATREHTSSSLSVLSTLYQSEISLAAQQLVNTAQHWGPSIWNSYQSNDSWEGDRCVRHPCEKSAPLTCIADSLGAEEGIKQSRTLKGHSFREMRVINDPCEK